MSGAFRDWLFSVVKSFILLVVSAGLIAIVTLNNSALLVTGSNIGVTLVKPPVVAQILALVLLIVIVFIIIYQVFWLGLIYYLAMLVLAVSIFVLSTHTFVWNYTEKKVQDIWLLYSFQEIPTVTKTADVNCKMSKYWLELEHSSGASIVVFKGLYPWVLPEKRLWSGCKNKP